MATNFPTNIDTFTDQTSSDLITSGKWNNLQDAIAACEAKIGVDSSAETTSLDYLVTNPLSEDPGHTHTLADGAVDVTATAAEVDLLSGATSTPRAGKAAIRDANAVVKGAELSMTGDAADEASAYEVTLDLGSVKEGDVVFLQGYSRVGWSSAPTNINLSIGYKSGTSYLKYFNEETTPSPLQYLTAPIIPTGTASTGAISGIGTVDQDGTLVVRAFVSRSGGTSLTYQTKIRAFFLKKQ